jgi:hypothetical protein
MTATKQEMARAKLKFGAARAQKVVGSRGAQALQGSFLRSIRNRWLAEGRTITLGDRSCRERRA